MSMSLWDHHQRLADLEIAFEVLRDLASADPEKRAALHGAAYALRGRGAKGAAELIVGDRASVSYRR
jgi:hypothetical protein